MTETYGVDYRMLKKYAPCADETPTLKGMSYVAVLANEGYTVLQINRVSLVPVSSRESPTKTSQYAIICNGIIVYIYTAMLKGVKLWDRVIQYPR